MIGLIKEDIKIILSKKRFIILAALSFVGALVMTIITKVKFWNDQTFFFAMQKYLFRGFNLAIGIALIISVYCREFTRTSIELVEEKGKGRVAGVMSRFLSGSLILVCCYATTLGWILLLGLVFGAHLTYEQVEMIVIMVCMYMLAAITSYVAALFFLYLFAFPVVPVIIYVGLMYVVSFILQRGHVYTFDGHKSLELFVPMITAETAYTQLIFSNFNVKYVVAFLVQLIFPLLFTFLVFKLK